MRELLQANPVYSNLVACFDVIVFLMSHSPAPVILQSAVSLFQEYLLPSKHVGFEDWSEE